MTSKGWPENEYTPIDKIPLLISLTHQTFHTGQTLSLAYRKSQLYALARLVKDNAEALADALHADLGRPKLEAYLAELGALVTRSLMCAERLEGWMAEEDVTEKVEGWQKAWRCRVRREAKGVALIIAPWNYPLILSLQPLMGAICAGCCAILKLSEISPHTSSLLAKLIPRYLDEKAYKVVLGGVKEISRVLEERFDHIFYTGNSQIARHISRAASKHLTPLTLELGGKSPVIIDNYGEDEEGLEVACRRTVWGKCNNAGQICVAPDYVLLPRGLEDKFTNHFNTTLHRFYPHGALTSESYSKIVSKAHFSRLQSLLRETKGTILSGGKVDEETMRMEPCLVVVEEGDVLLEGEIFGPILPVVLVRDVDEAIEFVRKRDHPLVLYAFTEDERVKENILRKTMSGSVSFNDTFGQLAVHELPFGGVGESGYGRQVMKATFEEFTYVRAVSDVPRSEEPLMQGRYPPYSEQALEFFKMGLMNAVIPDDPLGSKVKGNEHANGVNGRVNGNEVNGHANGKVNGHDEVKGVNGKVNEVNEHKVNGVNGNGHIESS